MLPVLDIENEKHQKLLFDLFGSLAKKHVSDPGNSGLSENSEGAVQIDYEKYAGIDDTSLSAEIEKKYNEILGNEK